MSELELVEGGWATYVGCAEPRWDRLAKLGLERGQIIRDLRRVDGGNADVWMGRPFASNPLTLAFEDAELVPYARGT